MSYIKTLQRQDVKVIQTFIDTMVGVPKFSYPARQNGAPKPKATEFAHIRLLEEYPVGIPNQRVVQQDENTTTYRTYSPVRLRFRIGVVDTNGVSSSKILGGWTSEAMKALMMQSGVGFILCEPLSDETRKLENEWEHSQGFSLEVYKTRVFQEIVDNIKNVTVSGEFIDVDKTYLINFSTNN